MAAKVGSLLIDISTNVAKVQKDMGKVGSAVSNATKSMNKAIKGVQAVMGALFAGVVLRDAIRFGKQIIDDADAMSKLATKTGVTVEILSAFGHAAELSGSNVATLAKGFKTLAANANDASMGTGEAKKAFEELDINVRSADGSLKSLDALLLESADAISRMTDETKQAAIASDIFGRAGFDLLPFLKKGKEGISEMTKEADRLGITIGTDFAKSAAQLNDDITELKASFEGLARDAMPEVVTISKDVVTSLKDILQAYRDLENFKPEDTFNAIAGSVADAGIELLKLATPLGVAVRGYNQLTDALNGTSGGADGVEESFAGFDADGFTGKAEKVTAVIKKLGDNVEESFNSFDEGAFKDWGKPIIEITPLVEQAAERSNLALESIGSIVGNVGRQISNFADGAKVDFKDMTQSILRDILRLQAQKLLTGIFTGLFGGGSSSTAKPTNTNVMSELERVPLPSFAYANGGIVSSPTMALAGEAGTEAFFPLDTKGGKLGISGSDSGAKTVINIVNNSSSDITTSSSSSANGDVIDVMITNKINQAGYNGDLNSMMKTVFNVSAQGVNR